MKSEIASRKGEFDKSEIVNTIYFGGGTPSVLSKGELKSILQVVHEMYNVHMDAEITVECNPDDLSKKYLVGLKDSGVNRLSIGIQSFNDEHLKWMNRSHSADQSLKCVELAAATGFSDITIDLIYGVPGLSDTEWRDTVKKALTLPITHLSAYSLTMEENTPYRKLVAQDKYERPDNDAAAGHYSILIEEMNKALWTHYEVSNFCKDKNFSKHNTAYWKNHKYIGIGPSAHSFDGINRGWNVANNKAYISKIGAGDSAYVQEVLSPTDRLNELMLTGLRTMWGIDLDAIQEHWNYDIQAEYKNELSTWRENGWTILENGKLRLTDEGLLMADYIASELFVIA